MISLNLNNFLIFFNILNRFSTFLVTFMYVHTISQNLQLRFQKKNCANGFKI